MKIPTLNSFIGRILNLIQKPFLSPHLTRRVRGFPADSKFVLSPAWRGDLYFLLCGCPNSYKEDFSLIQSEGPYNGDIFDVGANIGSYSMYFYSALRKGASVVYSFEPIQELAKKLQRTALANSCGKFLRVESVAVSDRDGMADIFVDVDIRKDPGQSSLVERGGGELALTIPTVTIDNFYKGEGVAFIKIDVEGNEPNVLMGARGVLEKFHPKIFFEVNKKTFGDYLKAYEVFSKMLFPLGYKLFSVEKGKLVNLKEELVKAEVLARPSHNWFAKV